LTKFKPKYSRQNIIGYIVAIFLSIVAIYLFIDSDYKEFKVLLFPLMMIVYFIIHTRYMLIKNIIFDDSIHVERFLWRETVIQYDKIEHITFASLKVGRKKVLFQGIINQDELIKILTEKVNEGRISVNNEENENVATKQYINMKLGVILFLLLFIIQGISSVFPYHLINSLIDGFIVWLIIYLIYYFITNIKID